MLAIVWLVNSVLSLYWWLIIGSAVFSWLYAFNIVNPNNQFISMIGKFLYDITEPLLRPIRRVVPSIGSVDISPIVLLLGIGFVRVFFNTTIVPAIM